MTPDTYAAELLGDLADADATNPRALQAEARVLGFSDIGGCAERTRRLLAGEPFTDVPDKTAARVGSWIDAGLKTIRAEARPHLLLDLEVHAVMPSGIRITGHPDEVDPRTPLVIDYKSKNGLAAVRRQGPSTQDRIQRALQYLACLQSGVFTSEDGFVGNVYLDRSGVDPDLVVDIHPWREERDWIEFADGWLRQVLIAVQHDRSAERTPERGLCRYCPFFSACRGADMAADEELSEDVAELAALHVEGKVLEEQGKALKDAVRGDLLGLTGRAGSYHLRTITDKNGTRRLEVNVLRSHAKAV